MLKHWAAIEAPELAIDVDSAGTGDYHIGEPPDLRSQRAALARGVDLSGLRARQIEPADFSRFDLILAMDRENLRDLERRRPPGSKAVVKLFLEYAGCAESEVPDPYMGTAADFEHVLDLTSGASRRLIVILKQRA